MPGEEQRPAARSSEGGGDDDTEQADGDGDSVTEQADTETATVELEHKKEAPESSPGGKEDEDGDSSQAQAVDSPFLSKSGRSWCQLLWGTAVLTVPKVSFSLPVGAPLLLGSKNSSRVQ